MNTTRAVSVAIEEKARCVGEDEASDLWSGATVAKAGEILVSASLPGAV
jgi:hypothetical protein